MHRRVAGAGHPGLPIDFAAAGLVRDTAGGRRRVYTLVTTPLDGLAGWLGQLMRPPGWKHRLDALETEVYRTRRERHTAAGRRPSRKESA